MAKLPNSRPREDRRAKEFDLLGEKLQHFNLTKRKDFVKAIQHRKKVEAYISQNENHIAIAKLNPS
ncbi:hypothetical protein ACL6C3_13190 [Capilliphycus salinus ALCB114379]|uniref:hypothetical protein n=1 Tax=Capilliphycus salinus TaxID=2768948 RepID=UPI0039A5AFDC